MKILFTTPMLLHPATSGPHLRIENSIKALSQITECHVISRVPDFKMGGEQAVKFYRQQAAAFAFAPSVKNLSTIRLIRGAQILLRRQYVNDAKWIVRYARRHQIQNIWFGYGNLSYPLIKQVRALAPDLKLICDTDSVWSRFLFRELPFVQDEQQKQKILNEVILKEQEEKDWVSLCDVTTAVSDVDAAYYQNLTQDKNKVAVFSNVIDVDHYLPAKAMPSGLKKPAVYLAGSFGKPGSAMNRAADWLLNDILPQVRRYIPNIHCYIVGNHSDVAYGHWQSEQVTVTGRVECVLPFLKNIDVALTPLLFESGTRFKILEAAACQVPMVSTTLGAEGLPVKNEEHVLIADSTEDFAKSIVRLIEDKPFAKQLANKSYQLVAEQFGLDQLQKEAKEILARIS